MNHMRLWAAAGIIALIVIAGFALSVPHTRDIVTSQHAIVATSTVPVVTVRDTYKKGVHTITGSVVAPNACTSVTASATLEGDASNTARIVLSLSLPVDSGICLQTPTTIPFTTTIAGPVSLPITAMVNGSVASSTAS